MWSVCLVVRSSQTRVELGVGGGKRMSNESCPGRSWAVAAGAGMVTREISEAS